MSPSGTMEAATSHTTATPRNDDPRQNGQHKRRPTQGLKNIRGILESQLQERQTLLDRTHTGFWGDPITGGQPIPDDTFRVWSQNINGLAPRLGQLKISQICDTARHFHASLVGLQETNVNWQHRTYDQLFRLSLKKAWASPKYATASTRLQWETQDQPGGTCLWTVDQWSNRVIHTFSDEPLGRWAGVTMQGTRGKLVTIISAYRVCPGILNLARPTTAYAQQAMLLQTMPGSKDPRSQCLADLAKRIEELRSLHHEIILLIDANDRLASENLTAFDEFLEKNDMADVLQRLHGLESPATHQRGKHRIDFIAATPGVFPACRKAGILPLGEGHDSDHRALYVDFDAKVLFSGSTASLNPTTHRQLTTLNVRALTKYIGTLRRLFDEHKTMERLSSLQSSFDRYGATEANIQAYNNLDGWATDRMLHAEKTCTHTHHQGHAWSPALRHAAMQVRYWALRRRQLTSGLDFTRQLRRLAKTAAIDSAEHESTLTMVQLKLNLATASKHLKELQSRSREIRDDFLKQRAEFWAERTPKGDAQKVLQDMLKREQQTRQFTQLRRVFQEDTLQGLEYIDVPREELPDQQCERIFDRDMVHYQILSNNKIRFQQTSNTPFGKTQRSNHMGLDGRGPGTKDMLRGRYRFHQSGLSLAAKKWISMLRYHRSAAEGECIDIAISAADFVSAWQKFRESTSSSPSGRHYGHYKAAAISYQASAQLPNGRANPIHLPCLAVYHAMMVSLPTKHGFAPKRWQCSVNAMLLKASKSRLVSKLRIIHLFEADFNFVLKLIWGRRLVRHAEQRGWLGSDQHGSRPGRQAIDCVLEKRLLYDFARLSKTSLVTIDNDAASCYDRIVKTVAMVACQGAGLPAKTATMHNLVHYQMVHRVKTAHGTSEDTYTGSVGDPLEGTGQGSGASPAIWLLLSSTLLRALARLAPGIRAMSPDGEVKTRITSIFYVDDGMPGVGDAHQGKPTSWQELSKQASTTATKWENLLHASGGALELTKCFCYAIYWVWTNGRARLARPDELCTPVTVVDSATNSSHDLRIVDPTIGNRTLGVRIAPSGSDQSEYLHRVAQGREIARALQTAPISRTVAYLGYRSIVTPKVEYPLSATCFTEKETDKITATFLPTALRKMGLPRNFPRQVLFAGKAAGGAGLHNLYIEQGLRQITALIGHIRQRSRTGELIKITLAWAQLIAGVSFPLLEQPSTPMTWVDACWVISLRKFLAKEALQIRLHKPPGMRAPQRTNDRTIMELFSSKIKGADLHKLNARRLYIRCEWMSDICSGDGRDLLPSALECHQYGSYRSKIQWPRSTLPPNDWRRLWKKSLETVCLVSPKAYRLTPDLRLGPWLRYNPNEWTNMYNPTTGMLLQRQRKGTVQVYQKQRTICGEEICHLSDARFNTMDDAGFIPATVRKLTKGYGVTFMGTASGTGPRPGLSASPFLQYARDQCPWGIRLMQGMKLLRPDILDTLEAPYTYDLASDAGMKDGRAAYAWAVYQGETKVAEGVGEADGYSRFQSSTRAEMIGLTSGLLFIMLAQRYYRWQQEMAIRPSFRVTCDNQGAIKAAQRLSQQDWYRPASRCHANADVEAVARWIHKQLAVQVVFEWVEGHQTPTPTAPKVSYLGRLNNAVDEMASTKVSEILQGNSSPRADLWPPAKCDVVHATAGTVTGDVTRETRRLLTEGLARLYFTTRYKWAPTTWGGINHAAYAAASRRYDYNDRLRILKLRTGWLPINKRACHYIQGRSAICPSCHDLEDVDHLFRCLAGTRQEEWRGQIRNGLTTIRTAGPVTEALMRGIDNWLQNTSGPETMATADHIKAASGQQSSIGWGLLCRGFVAIGWQKAQNEEKEETNQLRWGIECNRIIFDAFLMVWSKRNGAVHGTATEQRQQEISGLRVRVSDLYDRGTRILPCDKRWIFPTDEDNMLKRPHRFQRQWVRMAERAVPSAEIRAKVLPKGQRLITGFLPARAGKDKYPP
jgi:hypothetical protein